MIARPRCGPVLAAVLAVIALRAQDPPQLGYVFPAGLQRGTSAEVTIGGKNLQAVTAAHFAAPGLRAEILSRTRPMTGRERTLAQDKLRELQQKRMKEPLSADEESLLKDLRQKLAENRRQVSPQLAETLVLRVSADQYAAPGGHDLRLLAAEGISNPLRFVVGELPERTATEPDAPDGGSAIALPTVANGQILAGDVDRLRIRVQQGCHLVAVVEARSLIPYVADAVPGWFQATLTLRDGNGRELRHVDDRGTEPDPVLDWVVPADGECVFELADALCRGREDFVYRLTVGELPHVTSVFPLGARTGERSLIALRGFNLPSVAAEVDLTKREPGLTTVPLQGTGPQPFAVDRAADAREQEPNDEQPQRLVLPVVVDGTVDRPGDVDTFDFVARSGDRLVAEVFARRLGSPLDSLLRLVDKHGRELQRCDDDPATATGLVTHAADARLELRIANDGVYRLILADTQQKGGTDHAYRLHIGPPQPDFAVRVVPSAIDVRALGTAVLTVHVARRDGFAGDVAVALVDAPQGFRLGGALVPAGQDHIAITLTAGSLTDGQVLPIAIEGQAKIAGQEVQRRAVPCDDRMQAFAYRHLVPADQLLVAARSGSGRGTLPALRHHATPVRLRLGNTDAVVVADGARRPPNGLEFVLRDAPPGITLVGTDPGAGGFALRFAVERRDDLRAARGNLIVDVRQAAGTGRPGNRPGRTIATLPAIPFRIVTP
ncbi:MAG: hypothetical protein Q7T30_01305 [Planctomycetota bacterium]|nr:hypothetical protein [Planctomycetota bacterium]